MRDSVRARSLVAVEREGALLALRPLVVGPVGARDEEEVRLAVAVVVQHGDAAAHRLGHPLLSARAVDVREIDAHRRGLLGERDRGRRRDGRRLRSDGDFLAAATGEREAEKAWRFAAGASREGSLAAIRVGQSAARAATDCLHGCRYGAASSTGTSARSSPDPPRPVSSSRPGRPGELRSSSRPGGRTPRRTAAFLTPRRTAALLTPRRTAALLTPRRTTALLTLRRTTALLTARRATALRTTARRSPAPLRARRRATLLTVRRSRLRATFFRTPRPPTALLATRLTLRTLRTALRTRLLATLFLIAIVGSPCLGSGGGIGPGRRPKFSPGVSHRAALVSGAVFVPASPDDALRFHPRTRRSSVSPKSLIDHARGRDSAIDGIGLGRPVAINLYP